MVTFKHEKQHISTGGVSIPSSPSPKWLLSLSYVIILTVAKRVVGQNVRCSFSSYICVGYRGADGEENISTQFLLLRRFEPATSRNTVQQANHWTTAHPY